MLLAKGADVKAKNKYGRTVLTFSENLGRHLELAKEILDKCTDVNAKDDDGSTALMWAATAKFGSLELARMLLDKDADANAKNKFGHTALMWAVEWGNEELTKVLLKHGVDVNAKNKLTGDTALTHLLKNRSLKGVSLKCCKVLLAHGADVNAQDYDKYTALILAAKTSRPVMMTALMSMLTINLTAQDKDGKTAQMLDEDAYKRAWEEAKDRQTIVRFSAVTSIKNSERFKDSQVKKLPKDLIRKLKGMLY